ncbi:SDR family NAD(P)-dependent oxidoreductase [Coleofasciculus sp. E1-EBD-02]|uniref:SDR family NAD(P)-dependent oxidoreductase n=1 Tax=Coleofasciculus sp. E1-EBD-02 TaxID=3068481 RepID=UPI003300731C
MIDRGNLLIVGGSRGIGLALAIEALAKYSRVTVIAREEIDKIKELKINFISQDFNDVELIRHTLEIVQPSTLILCVAQGLYGNISDFPNDKVISCVQTTYLSTIIWLKEAILVLPVGSRIAWISSLTAKIKSNNWSFYASAKAGVEHFIRCIRESAKDRGIDITICYPGCLATEFHERSGTQSSKDAIDPSEIANDLLEAIDNRLEFWVSYLDKEAIEKAYQLDEIYQHKFKDSLK